MKTYEQVTIIGTGLIGGSLAAALKRENICKRIVGVDVNSDSLKEAEDKGIIEQGYLDIKKGVKSSDLIIIAVPVGNINSILNEIQEHAQQGTLIFDVGSIKGDVIKQANQLVKVRPDLYFIGGHPMAGSEKSGVKWSDPDIFKDAPFILVPLKETPEKQVANLSDIINKIGGIVKIMGSEEHDKMVGYISHLPHLIAFALVNNIESCHNHQEIFELSAGSFKDATRIAVSPPDLWADICLSNRAKLEPIFEEFLTELEQVKKMLTKGDKEGLLNYFEKAGQCKSDLLQEEK
ncbi:MAG TPA: prephenate dehydrogenase/arogenate dehydrogenase family protein [Halanaerobiales bacterium]|nr:prephenate dehydrogenase/arogenate dehydrogenase family protein [Halanaerobiales bacterium]